MTDQVLSGLIDTIAKGGAGVIATLMVVILAFVRGYIVPGRIYDKLEARYDRLTAVLENTITLKANGLLSPPERGNNPNA